MPLLPEAKNCDPSVKKNFRKISAKLGYTASPTYANITLTDLTASSLVGTNASKLLESVTIGTGLDYTRPNLSLSHLGIEDLTDPGADRIFFWDNSASASEWLSVGNSIAITTTTIDTIQDIRTSASPAFARLTLTDTCLVAGGANFLRVTGLQVDGTAMTGTLRGAYIDVSNGSTAATGTIRGMELKARTEAPGDTGNDVTVLEGLSISVDSKGHSVTTMRAAEFILDGSAGGTITEVVGLRIANNLQTDKATTSYGLQIYRDSFDYTADIQLSSGGLIGGSTGALKVTSGGNILCQPTTDSTTFFQVLDADGGTPILNVDSTNERVGVNTADPEGLFHVSGVDEKRLMIGLGGVHSSFNLFVTGGAVEGLGEFSQNAVWNGSAWVQQDTTKSSFIMKFDTRAQDRFSITHFPAGDLSSETTLIKILGNGDVKIGPNIGTDPVRLFELASLANEDSQMMFDIADTGKFSIGVDADDSESFKITTGATLGTNDRLVILTGGNIGFGGENDPETLTEWTHAQPYLALHNSTHEDSDGGRESRLNFKGEQGVSPFEETTLARIEVSHDGSGADDKGKIVISTNDGDDGNIPTDHIAIDAAGNTKIGDAGTTNYLNVDSGGRVLLVGTAQTWEDIRIVPGAFQFPGVADPTLQSWQPGGAGTTYKVYKFVKNDEVHFTCQIPHNYKEGSDLKPHLHWTPCDRGNEEDGNTVGWKIDYSWANFDAAFASSATVDLSDACSGIDDQHEKTDSGTITGTNKAISGILQIRLYRSDTGADDTWVGATAALSPAILEFDLHYEIDSLGSDLELTKDAP